MAKIARVGVLPAFVGEWASRRIESQRVMPHEELSGVRRPGGELAKRGHVVMLVASFVLSFSSGDLRGAIAHIGSSKLCQVDTLGIMRTLQNRETCRAQVTALSTQLLTLIWCIVGLGCTQAPEEPFSIADDVEALSDLHQQNIRDGLQKMFGDPSRPRIVAIVESDASEDGDDGDASEIDDTATSAENLTPAQEREAALKKQEEAEKSARLIHGAAIYRDRCAGCHGIGGDGQGPAAAYLQPRPRDYRKGIFKFTSTPYGYRPARQDLVRTVRRGAKGTSMPAFPWMSDNDLEAVVDYVIYLSLRGRVEEVVASMSEDYDEDEAIDTVEFTDALQSEQDRWQTANDSVIRAATAEPAYDEESVKLGRTLFIKSSCYQCHGADAEGQTEWLSAEFITAQESAPAESRIQINYDAWGEPAPAADITARMLHGGRRPLDIYRRIYTGINGTPMPAFDNVFTENPEAIWHLVHYVQHIVDGGDPTLGIDVKDVVETTGGEAGTTESG